MAKVEFLGPIQKEDMDIEIENLKQLREILGSDESLSEWLEISSVALNDEIVSSLDIEVKSNDKISILPPVCGG